MLSNSKTQDDEKITISFSRSIEVNEKTGMIVNSDWRAFTPAKNKKISPSFEIRENKNEERKKGNVTSTTQSLQDQYIQDPKQRKITSDVLVIGASGSGKTLLLRRLKNLQEVMDPTTMPTIGTDIDTITMNKTDVLFREVENVGFQLVQSWLKFSRETKVVLFLIDVTNYSQIAASVTEFYNVMLTIEELDIPIILTLNKIDCENMIDLQRILKYFDYQELTAIRQNIYLRIISAASGANVQSVIELIELLVCPDGKEKKSKKKCC